nr:hypothetical protein [Tanacetum cinerariifolium]
MAKATPTQAWLWHHRLSYLNFDCINLLSKKDIVISLPKLKYVKDQLCSSCELSKANRSSFKSKIVQLILFIVDFGCTKHMTGNLKLLCNFVEKFLGTVRFGNDQFAPILDYGDLVQGNVTINRVYYVKGLNYNLFLVGQFCDADLEFALILCYGDLDQGNIMIDSVYYVEGLNHNLFSIGQFCDADLEVAFRKSTCFVRDLQGNDLLIGYPKETMGYYFYYLSENKIVVERYADFLEKDFILQKESRRIIELEDEDILPYENTSEHPIEEESLAPIVSQEEDVIPVRRSVKTHKAPDRLCLNVEIDPDRLCFNVEVEEHSLGDLNEHANYRAALSDPEFEKWLVAINAEMQTMYDNKVWRLVVLPQNEKVVKSKWIYKKKTYMDSKIHIYKAQLVAKGCTQTYGVDYKETFSPVADIRAIRILIAIATYYDYEIWIHYVCYTFLVYGGDPEAELRVNCYCDAGFKTDRYDTKSQTGYVFILNEGAVVWKSSKQSTTTQHATEAEYIAASKATKEDVWIRKFIDELGVVPSNDYPIKMNCDNSAAIIMAKESRIQKGARHFKRKYHYVRECIKTGKIDIVKVHTDDNLVDPFTKALSGPKLTRHGRSMGLRPASSFM